MSRSDWFVTVVLFLVLALVCVAVYDSLATPPAQVVHQIEDRPARDGEQATRVVHHYHYGFYNPYGWYYWGFYAPYYGPVVHTHSTHVVYVPTTVRPTHATVLTSAPARKPVVTPAPKATVATPGVKPVRSSPVFTKSAPRPSYRPSFRSGRR